MSTYFRLNIIVFLCCLGLASTSFAQNVAINTTGNAPDSTAMLDISSPDKGLLIPRMDSTTRKNIAGAAKGLMVFDSTYNSFYFYDGTTWSAIDGGGGTPPDNLGDHTATQNFQLNNQWLNNDGDANEGLYIDASGQVGVGKQPTSALDINMGSRIETDISQTVFDSYTAGFFDGFNNTVCQSFTPTQSGILHSIEFIIVGTLAVTYKLHEGLGSSGPALTPTITQYNPTEPYLFSGVVLNAGQVYTIDIVTAINAFAYSTTDVYPGGQVCNDGNLDYYFKVNFEVPNSGGFKVTNQTVQINDYSLPITDGSNGQILSTDGSGVVSWSSPTANTDNQQLSLANDTLRLTNGGSPIALTSFLDNSDDQQLSLVNDTLTLTNSTDTIDLKPYLNSTDNQQLALLNDTLTLTNSTDTINLRPYLDNTDNQQLTLSNDTLILNNGGSPIDLKFYLDNTDAQDLSLMGNTLSLTNDGTPVNLMPYLDNTDNQQLSLIANNLSLTNGGSAIDLSGYLDADNLGNHTATQNVTIGSNAIQNNAANGNGLSLGSNNEFVLESNFQRVGHFTSTATTPSGESYGSYIEINNKTGTRSIFGVDGTGVAAAADTLTTVIGNWTSGGDLSFHVNGGTEVMNLTPAGRLGLGRTAATNLLEVNGTASKTTAGSWLANSDARLKKNITPLSAEETLDKMLSLQGVTYEWNDTQTGTDRPEGIQYGFTAQNIQEVFPILVTEDNLGYLQTPYGTYDAMTVEAIRALNEKITALQNENQVLRSENQEIKSHLSTLSSQVASIEALLQPKPSQNASLTAEVK